MASIEDKRFLNVDSFSFPFFRAKDAAINVNTVTCAVNAFVDATPISGPAWVYEPASVILEIEDPTTLQIPRIVALCLLPTQEPP